MVSAKICGPKCSICCSLVSAWGIVMLALMGVFFYVKSPALVEDLPLNETEWEDWDNVEKAYHGTAYNCWIATALYALTLAFSLFQYRLNARSSYQI